MESRSLPSQGSTRPATSAFAMGVADCTPGVAQDDAQRGLDPRVGFRIAVPDEGIDDHGDGALETRAPTVDDLAPRTMVAESASPDR